MKYILASASPRRQELLKIILPDFTCIPANIDEKIPSSIDLQAAPEYLAVQKARCIAERYPFDIIIGCDTCVVSDGMLLGKPVDADAAEKMLQMLSGKPHTVITGCALFYGMTSMSFSVSTEVEFYPLTEATIKKYINTGEPMDKAGAYGIQGFGATLVKKINGDYFNVVGLPVAELNRKLEIFKSHIRELKNEKER